MLEEASLCGIVQLHAVEHAASRCLELSRDMACCFCAVTIGVANKLQLVFLLSYYWFVLSWTCMQ